MAKKTRVEALHTKEDILNAAETLFLEKGVSHTSLHQIAVAANVTRGAIYWHFKDKVDLLQALLDRAKHPFDEQTTLILNDPHLLPEEKILKIVSGIAYLLSSDARIRNAVQIITTKVELVGEFAIMHDTHMRHFKRLISLYTSLLEQEYKRRQLSPTKEQINISAHAIYSILSGLFHNWILTSSALDFHKLSTHTIKTYLHGLWSSDSSL